MKIALSGFKRAGKSTVAKYLIEKYDFRLHYFAKPIKEIAKLFGLTEEQISGPEKDFPCKELYGKSPRWLQIEIGTNLARNNIHENIWVDIWDKTMPIGNIICDDLRFPNELDVLRKNNVIIVNIVRENAKSDPNIESESYSLPYDFRIDNNGDLKELYNQIEDILDKVSFNKKEKLLSYNYNPWIRTY